MKEEFQNFKDNNNPEQFSKLKTQLEDVTKDLIKKEQQMDLFETNKDSIEKINDQLRKEIERLQKENQRLNDIISHEK